MLKSELVQIVADKNPHLLSRDAENVVNTVLEEIINSLSCGQRVELRGFGTFSLKHRVARKSRNPKTGESVDVESKVVPHFKTSKEISDRLNR